MLDPSRGQKCCIKPAYRLKVTCKKYNSGIISFQLTRPYLSLSYVVTVGNHIVIWSQKMAEQLYIYNVCTSVKLLDMCAKQYILMSWHSCYSYLQKELTLVFSDGSTSGNPSRYLTRTVLLNLHATRSGEYPSDSWQKCEY